MASPSKKLKSEQPKALPALSIYQQQGNTLAALTLALQHGLANKEKDLAKTFQKQLFQAAGQDQYRLHLHDNQELNTALSLALALVNKTDNVTDWLDILQQPDYWHAIRLSRITPLLNKAVARLATHIPKVRNPANEGAPKFAKTPCPDLSVIPASAASLATSTIEGDATLVGARFFFEFVFYLAGKPASVFSMLLNKDPVLTDFLQQIGLDEIIVKQWHSKASQLPAELSPLHAQLLFKTTGDEQTISITPMLSVAAAAWLGQWRREALVHTEENQIGNRPLFNIEAAEYGGTNARNIAAILMDFSGKQQHPKILPPPVRRDTPDRLIRLIHQPQYLINAKPLKGKTLSKLASHSTLPTNDQLTQRLTNIIRQLLDELLEDVLLIKSLLDSQHPEALKFQAFFSGITKTHRHLQLVSGTANRAQIKTIAIHIAEAWLGINQDFKGGGERYQQIVAIIDQQLNASIQGELSL
ncbi:hypothetical protein KEF85_04520 [Methylomonas paludis]|uniref:Uncharacterized protein n=1 Tax=Methylomonas paludis TaxID=1173101 RepID=A0A975MPP7_9GAMM|nr:hypothetical protein [Methylomonas paludis]QWF71746.1 hypothetical protein KEF85_04520 [Methylomonas paludis]